METTIGTVAGNGFEMDYAVFGSGEGRLAIIPGLSVSPAIPTAGSVAAAYKCFRNDYTVYLFDRKKDIREDYSVFRMADDTAEAMRLLGIDSIDIFGASQGGMIGLSIAAHHPELVRRLALASTQPGPNGYGTGTLHTWMRLAAKDDPAELNRDIFSKVYSPAFQERYARALKVFEKNGTRQELDRFMILARAAGDFDIRGELGKIKCPVFLAGMEDDTVLSSKGIMELSEAFGVEPLIYPGKGHACYDEDRSFPEKLHAFFTGE